MIVERNVVVTQLEANDLCMLLDRRIRLETDGAAPPEIECRVIFRVEHEVEGEVHLRQKSSAWMSEKCIVGGMPRKLLDGYYDFLDWKEAQEECRTPTPEEIAEVPRLAGTVTLSLLELPIDIVSKLGARLRNPVRPRLLLTLAATCHAVQLAVSKSVKQLEIEHRDVAIMLAARREEWEQRLQSMQASTTEVSSEEEAEGNSDEEEAENEA